MTFPRAAVALCIAVFSTGCATDVETESDSNPEEVLDTSTSALQSGRLFPARAEDLPPGAVWRATNDHYDMHVIRWDASAAKWTRYHPGVGSPDSVDDYLVNGLPVYASQDGEIVTCWRNAPNNPIGKPHPGRDGCNDEDGDGNPCDQNATCSCTIPRSGNHVSLLNADGTTMLYAHLTPGSVPEELCPHDDEFVADAEELDPTLGGHKGHNPDMFVPVGSRAMVQKGQFLGYVGHSGASSGPHLHTHLTVYATGAKILAEYVGGQYQVYPGGSTNIDASDWEPLDGSTVLVDTASDPDMLVLPDEGPGNAWAYAWASNATADHDASSNYSRNSSGNVFGAGVTNSVDRLATGQYLVAFPGIGSAWAGNVQVSAYGSDNTRCKLRGFLSLFGSQAVRVDCHGTGGAPKDSRFVVSYVRNGSPTGVGKGAYVTTTDEGSGQVPIVNQWSSSGAPNTVERLSVGRYRVTMPGQVPRPRGGTVQVTAYGDSADYCKVGSWSTSGDAVIADVRCFATNGSTSDSLFSLLYAVDHPAGGLSGGHVWANNATASEYAPSDLYEYTHIAGLGELSASTTAYNNGTGLYQVRYPSLSTTGSSALVTGYGTTSDYCKISGWGANGSGALVTIRCFNASGNAVNTRFLSGYANVDFLVL